ncbi:MAG TPA: hypothetical protein VHE61_02735 [Opitutaceae bacterium]|nr:hypothetical protein [Opitutaceae bacterium]
MRAIHLTLACVCLMLAPLAARAARGGATTVRAIAFVASNERGPSDPRLAPYEGVLRRNLRFESFKYVGESAASVSAGGTADLSVPGGVRIELKADSAGSVTVRRGGTTVTVSRGRPAVFLGGPAGNGHASGVIVLAD